MRILPFYNPFPIHRAESCLHTDTRRGIPLLIHTKWRPLLLTQRLETLFAQAPRAITWRFWTTSAGPAQTLRSACMSLKNLHVPVLILRPPTERPLFPARILCSMISAGSVKRLIPFILRPFQHSSFLQSALS